MLKNTNINLQEVRKRAAQIRDNWSTLERRRRMGLPPDIPAKLRDYILAPRVGDWAATTRT